MVKVVIEELLLRKEKKCKPESYMCGQEDRERSI